MPAYRIYWLDHEDHIIDADCSLPTGTKTYGSASTSMSARPPPSKCGIGLVSWPGQQLGAIGHSNAREGDDGAGEFFCLAAAMTDDPRQAFLLSELIRPAFGSAANPPGEGG